MTKTKDSWIHPCLKCGACCSFYRVSFYWREAEKGEFDFTVPEGSFEELNSLYRVMKGTNQKNPRCTSLEGVVTESVACSIYENRPSPCRNFEASLEYGEKNIRCDQARYRFGLKPLEKEDWIVT